MEGSLLRSPSPFLICLNVFLVLNKQKSLTTMNEDTILVSVPTVQFLKVTGKVAGNQVFHRVYGNSPLL